MTTQEPHPEAVDRLRRVIEFKEGRPVWDARDREAVLLVLAELERLQMLVKAGPPTPAPTTVEQKRTKLSVVDGSSAWDPDVVTELRARFEKAILECDRIVIFSARRQGMRLVVDANSDTRMPPLIAWFEMLAPANPFQGRHGEEMVLGSSS